MALRMTGALVPGHDPTQPPAHGAAVIKLQLFRHIKGKTLYSFVFFAATLKNGGTVWASMLARSTASCAARAWLEPLVGGEVPHRHEHQRKEQQPPNPSETPLRRE